MVKKKITYVCWYGTSYSCMAKHMYTEFTALMTWFTKLTADTSEYYRNKLFLKKTICTRFWNNVEHSLRIQIAVFVSFSLSPLRSLSAILSFYFSNWESLSHALHTFDVLHFVADVCLIIFPHSNRCVCVCMTKA